MLKKQVSSVTVVITVVGLIINFGFLALYYTPSSKQLIGDENYYYNYGLNVASDQRIPDDILIWPPLYGEFIGLVFSIFEAQIIYIQIIQIGLWLTSGILFGQIVRQLTSSHIVTYISYAIFLLSPELISFSHYLWPEIFHLFLWTLGLWLLICYHQRRLAIISASVVFGLALLTKSILMPFILVVVLFIPIKDRLSLNIGSRLINATLMIVIPLLIVLPVMTKNLITQGKFIIADSSVFNVWVGLNDVGKTDHSANEIVGKEFNEYILSGTNHIMRDSVYKGKIVSKLEQEGLSNLFFKQINKQYFRLFDIQTFFTTQLPGGGRQAYTTTSQGLIKLLKGYSYVIYGFILVAGVAGLSFLDLRYVKWPHLFAVFIIYNLGLFLILHVKTRYVLQFLPVFIFFASISSYCLISKIRKIDVLSLNGFVFNRSRLAYAFLLGILMGITMTQSLI